MPKIAELRVIDGELWAKVGAPGEFVDGISLMTPEEVQWVRDDAVKAYIFELEIRPNYGDE